MDGRLGECDSLLVCQLVDTDCTNDVWCYKGGRGGRCLGGACDTGAGDASCEVIGNVTFKQLVTSGEAQEIHVLTPVGVRVGTDASQSVLEPRGESLDQAPSVLFELFANPECAAALATAQFVVASNTSSAIAVELRVSPHLTFVNISLGERGACRKADSFNSETDDFSQAYQDAYCHVGCDGSSGNGATSLSSTLALASAATAIVASRHTGIVVSLAAAAVLGDCGVLAQTDTTSPTTAEATTVPPPSVPCSAFVRVRWLSNKRSQCLPPVANVYSREQRSGIPLAPVVSRCKVGRPFVVNKSMVLSAPTGTTDDARAARWVSQGLGEHASVASFAAFCDQPQSLEKLAEAAFREGCIAETLSVFDAARQVDENDVADDEERNVLIGIVRDEARHSALAWRTVAWATGTAQSAALNKRLKQIAIEESARCVAHNRDVFERLILPLATKLIGTSDWERVVESEDVDVEIDPSRTLTESTSEAILATF
jgi:hypothetical protein